MTRHPRYQYKPEDLFLTVFVYLDDWLKPYQKLLPRLGSPAGGTDSQADSLGPGQQPAQKASYSELLTIAIVGEILTQPHESTWYWIVNQLFREL
ncbi:MAG: hypothetical protein OXC09_13175 [Truepera sp.]|nr:hypothetical protein [Truepera sp.]